MDRGRRTLLLIAAIFVAPVAASYIAYYFYTPGRTSNYGDLLTPPPAGAINGVRADGTAFSLDSVRGRWAYLVADSGSCTESCQRKLYATRQSRKLQGKDEPRVVRVFLVTDAAATPAELRNAHPDVVVVRVDPGTLDWLPAPTGAREHVWLLDPLGNAVLRYTADPDIKRMSTDLSRLLKASRIG